MANKIGSLWEKTSKKGETFLSGSITIKGQGITIVCFKNSYKKPGDNQPDWVIQESEPYVSNKPRQESKPQFNTTSYDDDPDIAF